MSLMLKAFSLRYSPEEIPSYYVKEWANLKYFLPGYYEKKTIVFTLLILKQEILF